MNWPAPGNDPWYQNNPDHNTQRRQFYGINSIPQVYVDGTNVNAWSSGTQQTSVLNRRNVDSPLQMTLDAEFDGDMIQVSLEVLSDETLDGSYRLHAALCETYVEWTSPAPNGMTEFHYPMLWMDPSGTGQTFTASSGIVQDFDYSFVYDESWSLPNLTVLAFVQNTSTREIIQSVNTQVPAVTPLLLFDSFEIDDEGQWRPNGRADAGESVSMIVTLRNHESFLPATNITGTLTCDDPLIEITSDESSWDDLQPGETADNSLVPFVVQVPEPYEPQYVTFTVHTQADGGYERDVTFEALMGVPSVLMVNDYGEGNNYWETWAGIIDELGVVFDVVQNQPVTETTLAEYETVIWATGTANDPETMLNYFDYLAIQSFLDDGGHLLLTSQYAGEVVGEEDWFQDLFGVTHLSDAVLPPASYGCYGIEGGAMPDAEFLLVGAGGAGNSESPSSMTPLEGTVPFFTYRDSDEVSGVGFEGDGFKTIYLGFPLEAISGAQGTTSGADVLSAMLAWFSGTSSSPERGENGVLPTEIALTAYPNPFNPELTVRYDLPSAGQVTVQVFDILGRQVAELVNGTLQAGHHEVTWDAATHASGLYLLRMNTPQGSVTQKAMLLR